MNKHRNERGYSLMEMLVVVAIIGVLMLVTIPNFITMRKSSIVKGSLRQFTGDLRAARQRAVTRSSLVRVAFVPGKRQYYIEESTNEGVQWNPVGIHPRYLQDNVYIENSSGASAFTDTVDDGTLGDLPDIVFERTGVAQVPNGLGKVLVKTTWTEVPKPTYTISIRTTGSVQTQ
jgi:prepilin-type N-terminal cleavage/methylation domain-containing protein